MAFFAVVGVLMAAAPRWRRRRRAADNESRSAHTARSRRPSFRDRGRRRAIGQSSIAASASRARRAIRARPAHPDHDDHRFALIESLVLFALVIVFAKCSPTTKSKQEERGRSRLSQRRARILLYGSPRRRVSFFRWLMCSARSIFPVCSNFTLTLSRQRFFASSPTVRALIPDKSFRAVPRSKSALVKDAQRVTAVLDVVRSHSRVAEVMKRNLTPGGSRYFVSNKLPTEFLAVKKDKEYEKNIFSFAVMLIVAPLVLAQRTVGPDSIHLRDGTTCRVLCSDLSVAASPCA